MIKGKQIGKTDIKINLLYRMAIAQAILLANVEDELAEEKKSMKHEIKQGFTEMIGKVKDASECFFRRIEPNIRNTVFKTHDWRNYDMESRYANEMLRLVLRYEEKTANSTENYNAITEFMRNCPGGLGLITEEEITNEFTLQ